MEVIDLKLSVKILLLISLISERVHSCGVSAIRIHV
jgi:hypothetical protein